MELLEQIKCFLRKNKFYVTYCQTTVNDCRYWFRGIKYYTKLYHYRSDKNVTGNTVYFIIDPNISHPGLADRFKAIIGAYYVALQNGFDFKIIFNHPFELHRYLICAEETNWIASFDDLSYSLKNSRIIAYNGGGKVPKLSKRVKQYHIYSYIGYDILYTNKVKDHNRLWGVLFKQLFKPSPILSEALEGINLKENEYISIHLRFVNALEQVEENQFNHLTNYEKDQLIQSCLLCIRNIISEYPKKKILVFSDSNIFLNHVRKELPVIVLDGKVGHISFKNSEDVVLKTFVDFYVMSKSLKVIRILNKNMYATAFSYHAALAGGKECIDYPINYSITDKKN